MLLHYYNNNKPADKEVIEWEYDDEVTYFPPQSRVPISSH